MTTRSVRAAARWSAVLAVSTALAACSPSHSLLGLTANTAVLSSRPAVTVDQATAIAGRALGQAQRADALRTPEAARSAFVDLALDVAPPRYVVQQVLNPVTSPGGALAPVVRPSRIIVTAGRTFPRTIVAVWRPAGSSVNEVAVMDCPDVKSPFRVSVRADLVPGTQLPRTAPNTQGASLLGADVSNLAAAPTQVVSDFAQLLQTGKSGGTEFASSIVDRDMRANAASQAKDVSQVAMFTQRHQAIDRGLRVIRTADGGAIVVGAINRVDGFNVRKGAGSITPPAAYRALSGGKLKQINKSSVVRTLQVVIFVVPMRGKGPVQVVGYTETPVAVSGS